MDYTITIPDQRVQRIEKQLDKMRIETPDADGSIRLVRQYPSVEQWVNAIVGQNANALDPIDDDPEVIAANRALQEAQRAVERARHKGIAVKERKA